MRMLLVEDDAVLADGLIHSLRRSGNAVDWARNGAEADVALGNQVYDLAILDLGLPKLDGFEVLRRLRDRGQQLPVLILTARDGVNDRVHGLDFGADDYMTKPFALPELEARIRALLRRGHGARGNGLSVGPLRLDPAGHCALVENKTLDLSARELALLEVLMRRSGRVVSKEQLLEHLYGWDEEAGGNAIEVCVHRLRKKLVPYGVTIRTMRGLGYLLNLPTYD